MSFIRLNFAHLAIVRAYLLSVDLIYKMDKHEFGSSPI